MPPCHVEGPLTCSRPGQRKREAQLAGRRESLRQRLSAESEDNAARSGNEINHFSGEEHSERGSQEASAEKSSFLEPLTFPMDNIALSNAELFNNDQSAEPLSITSPYVTLSDASNESSMLCSPHSLTNSHMVGDGPPSEASSSTTFPDSYYLQVPPLTLLRGLLRVATRLNAVPSSFSLAALSPFNLGFGPDPSEIPRAWRPTAAQLSVPHHPVLDLLPWPSVRDRLIEVLSLTEQSAELSLVEPPRLVNFVYDMEDAGEGIRIWGSDPFDERHWEVGQVLYERWWFVFDRSTVEQSNYLRLQRGAPPLRLI